MRARQRLFIAAAVARATSVLLSDAHCFDDLTFVPGAAPAPAPAPVISFDESTPPVLTGFGGAEDSNRLQREQPDDDRARSRRNAGRPLAASPGIAAFFLTRSGAASLLSRRPHRASVDLLRPI